MRNRNFCWCSFVLVTTIITIINYLILRAPKIDEEYNIIIKPVHFNELQSDASGMYKIWPLFGKSTKTDKGIIDITIVTQSSVSNLPDIEKLVTNWDGQVSVGVFTLGEEIELVVKVLYSMIICNQAVRRNVVFSLVLALSHPPKNSHDLSVYVKKAKFNRPACQPFLLPDIIPKSKRHKNYDNQVPYPVNLLRNIALANVKTSHAFVIDIDMSPSKSLRRSFQIEYSSFKRKDGVYVVPAFELKNGIQTPSTKEELVKLWNLGDVRPFYETVCWKCQRYTDYMKWRDTTSKTLSVLYKVGWQDPWEPFFIVESKRIVYYDERFKQYGFNRISQVCETHVSGGDFHVLSDAYLVHHGFKEKSKFHTSKDAENAMNRDLYRTFKIELKSKYPTSERRC